ncbi:hypothetical protein Tco_1547426 [Tanacetum coccineum]
MMGHVLPSALSEKELAIWPVTVKANPLLPTTTRELKGQIKELSLALSVELRQEPMLWALPGQTQTLMLSRLFIDIIPTILEHGYDVELADGRIIWVNTLIRGCTFNFLNRPFNIDLMPVEMGSFDVIIGMDWRKTSQKEKRLKDVPIVQDFPEDLPVKDALEKTPLPFAQSSSPGQSTIKAAESLSENPSKKSSKSKESGKGKTPSTTSKTSKSVSADKSAQETEHVVLMDVEESNLNNVAKDAEEPQADDIPKIPKKDLFKKDPRPETLDLDWNTIKTINDAPEQPWFNEMVKAEKPPLTFDEFMSTPIDFFAYAMNRLKLNKITSDILVGPVFNLLKGHKSPVDMSKPLPLQDKKGRLPIPVKFFFNNDLEYLKAGNKERSYSSSITKPPAARYTLEGIEDMIPTLWSPFVEKNSGYGYFEEIFVRRADQKLYNFKEGDFLDLHLNDIEDMLLLIVQNKLFNLDGDVIVDFVTALKISEKLRSAGWWEINRDRQTTAAKDSMTRQNQRDLPRDIPLDIVEVLRYDKRSKSENENNVD